MTAIKRFLVLGCCCLVMAGATVLCSCVGNQPLAYAVEVDESGELGSSLSLNPRYQDSSYTNSEFEYLITLDDISQYGTLEYEVYVADEDEFEYTLSEMSVPFALEFEDDYTKACLYFNIDFLEWPELEDYFASPIANIYVSASNGVGSGGFTHYLTPKQKYTREDFEALHSSGVDPDPVDPDPVDPDPDTPDLPDVDLSGLEERFDKFMTLGAAQVESAQYTNALLCVGCGLLVALIMVSGWR